MNLTTEGGANEEDKWVSNVVLSSAAVLTVVQVRRRCARRQRLRPPWRSQGAGTRSHPSRKVGGAQGGCQRP